MRPHGGIRQALAQAAEAAPGAVRQLAERAQVGYDAARYTAARMVTSGELVVLHPGRPAVLALPPAGESLGEKLDALHRSFWDQV